MENVGRISPACHALDRLATKAARLGGSGLIAGGASPSVSGDVKTVEIGRFEKRLPDVEGAEAFRGLSG
jgi:hypothetical protein